MFICDKMKPKSKIVKHLENLIAQIPTLVKDKNLPYSTKYDFWKIRVELFLNRVCGEKIAEEFKKTFNKKEFLPSYLFSSHKTLEQRFEERRKRQKLNCQVALCKAKNLLKAVKEDIKLFGSDKEVQKEVETIKRKSKEYALGPSFLRYRKREEVETKSERA